MSIGPTCPACGYVHARDTLTAPFPWFGGKRRVAPLIWKRFGDVPNYVEPFFGSGAVLLGRPAAHRAKIETVNDADGFVANFWRAVSHDPEGTARWADWPVNEVDLNARHAYLVAIRDRFAARLEGDPDYYDTRVAGWWVAGVCGWIGSGYCSGDGPWRVIDGEMVDTRRSRHQPEDPAPGRGAGHQPEEDGADLSNAGRGIKRQIPHLSDAGQGINRKIPHLGNAITEWFTDLATRLRSVRVTTGDWSRVVTESVTTRHGITGVFLDPPYGDEVEQTRVYASDSGSVSDAVRDWCLANGSDERLRIALCGYAGEGHEVLEDHGWTAHAWLAAGGYGGGRGGTGGANRSKERIWFSPACDLAQDVLPFEEVEGC